MGNDKDCEQDDHKGKVEGLVGHARRNFMVPIRRFESWEAFNAHLAEQMPQASKMSPARAHGDDGEELRARSATMLPLPAAMDEACEKVTTRVAVVGWRRSIEIWIQRQQRLVLLPWVARRSAFRTLDFSCA